MDNDLNSKKDVIKDSQNDDSMKESENQEKAHIIVNSEDPFEGLKTKQDNKESSLPIANNDQNEVVAPKRNEDKPEPRKEETQFPFKPVNNSDNEMTFGPQISVDLEKNEPKETPKEKIEKKEEPQTHKFEVKKIHPDDKINTSSFPSAPTMKPRRGLSWIALLLLALLFIASGFAGGYFAYKYIPSINKLLSLSADSKTTDTTDASAITNPKSTAAQVGDISLWPSYANSQYSVKYPDTWYAKGINDPNSQDVIFSSINPEGSTSTAYKVEITMQSAGANTLENWITQKNTVSNTPSTSALTPIQVAGMAAFQQSLSGATNSLITYLMIGTKVMTITYSAPPSNFSTGQTIYNQMLNSITI